MWLDFNNNARKGTTHKVFPCWTGDIGNKCCQWGSWVQEGWIFPPKPEEGEEGSPIAPRRRGQEFIVEEERDPIKTCRNEEASGGADIINCVHRKGGS